VANQRDSDSADHRQPLKGHRSEHVRERSGKNRISYRHGDAGGLRRRDLKWQSQDRRWQSRRDEALTIRVFARWDFLTSKLRVGGSIPSGRAIFSVISWIRRAPLCPPVPCCAGESGKDIAKSHSHVIGDQRRLSLLKSCPTPLICILRTDSLFGRTWSDGLGSSLGTLRSTVRTHRELALENLALRQQLAVWKARQPRPRLTQTDRIFWVLLSRRWRSWRHSLQVVRPETVVGWHRQGFKRYWAWKSRRRWGRPAIGRELRDLIRQMSRANPLWGAPRIHGELLKLGLTGLAGGGFEVHAPAPAAAVAGVAERF
jgi:hypothetical protein